MRRAPLRTQLHQCALAGVNPASRDQGDAPLRAPNASAPRGARLALLVAAVFVAAGPAAAVAAPQAATGAASRRPKTGSSSSFDAIVKKAAAAKEAGRYDDAIQYYREALKLKPAWFEGRFFLGTLLYDNDRYEEARDEFRRLVQADPKNGLVLALKGLCEFQLKSYERALKELQAARDLGISSPDVMSVASYHLAILLIASSSTSWPSRSCVTLRGRTRTRRA